MLMRVANLCHSERRRAAPEPRNLVLSCNSSRDPSTRFALRAALAQDSGCRFARSDSPRSRRDRATRSLRNRLDRRLPEGRISSGWLSEEAAFALVACERVCKMPARFDELGWVEGYGVSHLRDDMLWQPHAPNPIDAHDLCAVFECPDRAHAMPSWDA